MDPAHDPQAVAPADPAASLAGLLGLAHELTIRGEPYALVTVVRTSPPTSAYPGAQAIVRADGTLHGWVGGACARRVVVAAALDAMRRAVPRLVRIGGERGAIATDIESHRMSCASDGEIELFLNPAPTAPRLLVLGDTPTADAARRLAREVGWQLAPETGGLVPQLVLVATQGEGDLDALEAALRSGARRVLLVASARKAAKLGEQLRRRGLDQETLSRLEAPAGPDIGAHAPAEIALAAIAGAVAWWRATQRQPGAGFAAGPVPPAPATAGPLAPAAAAAGAAPAIASYRNPVCGMAVDPARALHVIEYAGSRFYFCCDGCKEVFERAPERYAAIQAASPASGP